MGNQLWNPKYGIKLAAQPGHYSQLKQPVEIDQSDQPPPADAFPARNGFWDIQNRNNIDKVALHGFTIAELIELGALAAANEESKVLPNNLENEVHQAFSIDKWETSVPLHFKRKHMFPLGPDSNGRPRPGSYMANNLVVWKALLPCLKLASKFLEYAHIFPWYQAVLHSEIHRITNVTPEVMKLSTPLRKLYIPNQSNNTTPANTEATRARILDISRCIRLGISDGNVDPTGNNPKLKMKYDGVALPPGEDDNRDYRIYVAYQIIEPLLEDEIGPSTRLALQFHVALTLLHEFAHVLVFAKDGTRDIKLYFGNERISEAGFSFEMSVFGGHPALLLQYAYTPDYSGPLRAGFLLEDWLGTSKSHQWNKPLSGTDADWNDREWREARSIPISFLEELGQEDFWRCFVGRWGAEALKVYPWTEGRLVQRSGNALKTQIYSTLRQKPAWLTAAEQASHKPDPLTPDENIAVRIANRRINRDKEINNLMKTRWKLRKQKTQPHCQKTPLPEDIPEADPENRLVQGDHPAAMAVVDQEDEKPWDARVRDTKRMKIELAAHQYECAEDYERVNEFMKRTDKGTAEYNAAEMVMYKKIQLQLIKFQKLLEDAFDSELLEGYESMLESYEEIQAQIGQQLQPTSGDRELRAIEQDIDDFCQALLRRAFACRGRGEHEKCCEYCHLIFEQSGVSQSLRARTNHLCGLSTSDLDWKIWYLMEAIRLYRLMEHRYGTDEPPKSLVDYRTHAEKMLAEAEVRLETSANAAQSSPKATQQTQPSTSPKTPEGIKLTKPSQLGTPPETPLRPIAPQTTSIDAGKTPPKAWTGFRNTPGTAAFQPINLDPAPKSMSTVDIYKHRKTHKVINTAKQNFMNGDYDLAEKGFLELLDLESTSEWQKARCHVFLASIQTRSDRAQRAQTALDMYRGFLGHAPEDERCVRAVKEAEELVERVKAELLCDQAAVDGPFMRGSVANGHAGKDNYGRGLETILEDAESEIEDVQHKTPPDEKEEPVSFVAGVVGRVASFLGLKRRREDDDDGEGERASKRSK